MPIDCQWVYWGMCHRSTNSGGVLKLPGIAAPPWVNKLLGLQYDLQLNQQQQHHHLQQQHQPYYCGTTLLQQLFLLVSHVPRLATCSVRLIRLIKKLPQEQVARQKQTLHQNSISRVTLFCSPASQELRKKTSSFPIPLPEPSYCRPKQAIANESCALNP
jgi:hypothetical protein